MMLEIYEIETGARRQISAATWAAWETTDNPKRLAYALLPTAPAHDPATEHPPVWNAESKAWSVAQKTQAEIAASTRRVWESSAAFWSEFSDAEKLGIIESEVAGIKLLREELRLWTGEVWSDDPRVVQGLAGLVALGLITQDRATAITAKN
jgi:hypothetical protein